MSIIQPIVDFVTNPQKATSTKVSICILIVLFILLMNNLFVFLYYHEKKNQLNQLQSITTLLNDPNLSSTTKEELKQLEHSTLKRLTIVDHSIVFFDKIKEGTVRGARNEFLFLISSSGFYIITVFLILMGFLSNIPSSALLFKNLPILISTVTIYLIMIWLFYTLFDIIIPDKVFGSWTWNYIINFVLQIGLLIVVYRFSISKPSRAND